MPGKVIALTFIMLISLVLGLTILGKPAKSQAGWIPAIGCYQIDRYGFLCIPGSPEMFVQEAHDGYTQWKQPHRPQTSCCNNEDCKPVEARDIPPEIIPLL